MSVRSLRSLFTVVFLVLVVEPLHVYAQPSVDISGATAIVDTIYPGVMRSDGFTTLGSLRRYTISATDYLPHVVMVKTKQYIDVGKDGLDAFPIAIQDILRSYGVSNIRQPFADRARTRLASADRYGLGRVFEVRFSVDANVIDLCNQLNRCVDVEYAEPQFIRHTSGTPNDPRLAEQYALARVEASGAWDITQGDTSVTIAIVDGGVNWGHEDLAANIWTNTKEIPDNKIDDDNNGKVDDVRGWDFVGSISSIEALQKIFKEDNDPGVADTYQSNDGRYHGTHCAGVAGAVTNNDTGIAGMGYHCRLIPVKCGSDQITGSIYRGYEGIVYAASIGAKIISCSWGGGPYSKLEEDAINAATAMGSLIVAASGNDVLNTDNFKHYPSSYANVLSVNASDSSDRPARFTNYGISTTVFAPGVNILSTVGDHRYDGKWSGTSMATPLVSGVAALLRSQHPDWTPGQIIHQIRSTCDDVVAADSMSRPVYFGRVNARRAVEYNRTPDDSNAIAGVGLIASGVTAPGGIITDSVEKTLRLTLRNYLAPVSKLRVTVLPYSNDVSVISPPVVIDTLSTMDTTVADITIRVTANARWYQGTADLLVRYDAPGYVDFELVQIPYVFPSNDRFQLLVGGLPGNTEASSGHSPAPNVLWGVGEVPGLGGGFIKVVGTSFNYNFISPAALTSVFSLNANRAFTVSGPTIFSTTNGGSQWLNTSIASVTRSIQSISFFSTASGIVIGNPINTTWGIAVTSDSGATWNPIASAPSALESETVVGTAVAWRGDDGWFGTSEGRVFHSSDGGATWSQSKVADDVAITHLAFTTPQMGVAIYHAASDSMAQAHIASTTDGGGTWTTDVARLDELGIVPVHLAAPGAKGVLVMLGNDGAVLLSSDNGATWTAAATSKTNAFISAGTTSFDNATIRVWSLGTLVGYLDIPFASSSAPVIADESVSTLSISSVHPNPAGDRLTIDITLARNSHVRLDLINELGEVVLSHDAGIMSTGTDALRLDVSDVKSGIYLCRVTSDGASDVRMVTIRR